MCARVGVWCARERRGKLPHGPRSVLGGSVVVTPGFLTSKHRLDSQLIWWFLSFRCEECPRLGELFDQAFISNSVKQDTFCPTFMTNKCGGLDQTGPACGSDAGCEQHQTLIFARVANLSAVVFQQELTEEKNEEREDCCGKKAQENNDEPGRALLTLLQCRPCFGSWKGSAHVGRVPSPAARKHPKLTHASQAACKELQKEGLHARVYPFDETSRVFGHCHRG